jgi:hypothetical protein
MEAVCGMRLDMRIVLAGILGGIVMFVWSAIAHMATPLAYTGISKMQNEKAVLDGFKQGIGKDEGLFFFPWTDPKDPKAMEKEVVLMKTEPSGILIYHPPGADTDMTPMLVKEFAKEVAQSLLAALLLGLTALTGYFVRVGFVTLVGVFAALGADTSYWIWYGFPLSYTLAVIAMQLIGVIAAGLVIAALVKPKLRRVLEHRTFM